jgi:amino acid transporter
VAVSIAAGVGALISQFPKMQPYTTESCLFFLAVITLVNLRGVKESGLFVAIPTYSMIVTLGIVFAYGAYKTFTHGGHPIPEVPLPNFGNQTEAVSIWLLLKAFANGCAAMTGVEAVSNGVTLFKAPSAKNAQLTLSWLVGICCTCLWCPSHGRR